MPRKSHTIDWYRTWRAKNMAAARNWQAHYRNSRDAGALEQMRIRVRLARANNHAIIQLRREGR